jgi:hypothetical protein
MSHLWQRLLRATALVFGLALGVAATVFAYSNTATVNVGWSLWHVNGIPLWTVAIVPLVLVLAVGTVYHWLNNLHHFTEHMRHRRRVRELEAELASLKAHLDTALGMPDHAEIGAAPASDEAEPAEPEPLPTPIAASNGDDKAAKKTRKRPAVLSDTEPVAVTDVEPKPEETPAET